MEPKYIHHLFRSHPFQEEFYRFGKGIVADLWSTNYSEMKNINIPIPSSAEQQKIANFLDRETSRIDSLIEEKANFIKLLKEKRQALITHAVTKGLDPNVKMKDSGIEWIGEVPEHWEIKPLFIVGSEGKRSNKGMAESNLLSLSYGKIKQKDIHTVEGLLPESFETYQIVEKNDIVFRLTDLQNDKHSLRSAIVNERGIITSAYISFIPNGINPFFLNYQMRCYDNCKVFYNLGSGLRQSLRYEELKRIPILAPKAEEQVSIANFLDRETSKIDLIIDEVNHSIDLLKEHRSALISAAVTGKIDVRDQYTTQGN